VIKDYRKMKLKRILRCFSCFSDPYSDRLISLLHEAHWENAMKLIRRGEGLHWTSFGWTALHIAIWKLAPDRIILAMLRGGLSANDKDYEDGETAVHFAVKFHPKSVKALLENSGDCNCPSYTGTTPLALAASKGDLEILNMLLNNGGSPNKGSNDGTTPLMCAVKANSASCVRALLRAGARKDAINHQHKTCLELAKEGSSSTEILCLLDDNMNIIIALCAAKCRTKRGSMKTQTPILFLPIELIRLLSMTLGVSSS